MTQVDGSPERPQQSYDLDTAVAYQVGSNFKVLKAPSTMRSQPKISHVDPRASPTKLRSSVWRTSSRESATSGNDCDDEEVNDQVSSIKKETIAMNQMDGAGDSGPLSFSCRVTVRDRKKGDVARRNDLMSLLPVAKSRMYGLEPQSTPKNSASPRPGGELTKPLTVHKAGLTPSASKVRGLAAMFDIAAKASPFVPTPGGAIQKKRRETARVVSPYTSNPSPRVSVQTVNSVSTPASLMSPSKSKASLSSATESMSKRSFIPRIPNSPLKNKNDNTFKTNSQSNPAHDRRDESCVSAVSSTIPSRIPTPSRLSSKKKDSVRDIALLPQLDGSAKILKSPLRLTPQHTIRPIGQSPSAIPQLTSDARLKCLPRLPHHSIESFYSDDDTGDPSQNVSLSSPSLSRSRNPSSLRDRIRSLRSELSAKNEDCAQLRMEFEGFRKTKEVSEILLREDLDRARSDVAKWRRRAEMAEIRVERFERLAARIENERQLSRGCDQVQDYSFMSGSDVIDVAEHSLQPLTARMNQSIRRAPKIDDNCVDLSSSVGGDVSDCSENTILRNITTTSHGARSATGGNRPWNAADELVDFSSPAFSDECL